MLTKATALDSVSIGQAEWDIAGDCDSPYGQIIHGREESSTARLVTRSISVILWTRCRRCDKCYKQRQNLWRLRMKTETSASFRTWLATLTLSPEQQFRHRMLAVQRAQRQGSDFDALPAEEQFRLRIRAVNPSLTKFFKRLRKKGLKYRYCFVCEAHKSGLPHYHGLIHEIRLDAPVRYAQLEHEWPLGFSQYRLVKSAESTAYLAKYLSKAMLARVRASQRYGRAALDDLVVIDRLTGREFQTSNYTSLQRF